jgi:hypothetical protein
MEIMRVARYRFGDQPLFRMAAHYLVLCLDIEQEETEGTENSYEALN